MQKFDKCIVYKLISKNSLFYKYSNVPQKTILSSFLLEKSFFLSKMNLFFANSEFQKFMKNCAIFFSNPYMSNLWGTGDMPEHQ